MNPTEARQSGFGISPERLNSVYMRFTTGKFILSMMNSKVFFVTEINKTIIASPAITVDDTIEVNLSSDYGL